jgi:hypothetical protein
VRRAVQLYTAVGSWDKANCVAKKIILPFIKYIRKEDIEEIIKSPQEKGADLPGSHGFTQFLDALSEQECISRQEIND